MKKLLSDVTSFFEKENWLYSLVDPNPIPGETGILTSFKGKHGHYSCFGLVIEKDQRFAFYATCPTTIPEEKLPAVAEFLHRANFDMVIGNFELGYEPLEIRFKASIDVEGNALTHELIKGIVYPVVLTMDTYYPYILKLIFGEMTPEEVLVEIG
ncbi:YbjN domain-containing protein [bacterium]|nr:YbjN domain-containing protein [bacterium]